MTKVIIDVNQKVQIDPSHSDYGKVKLSILKERTREDFGIHENDFEHKCCFKDMIQHIGRGTINGDGELVKVAMQSGKTAIYKLFSERYCHTFEDTGQKNWRYHFVRYE